MIPAWCALFLATDGLYSKWGICVGLAAAALHCAVIRGFRRSGYSLLLALWALWLCAGFLYGTNYYEILFAVLKALLSLLFFCLASRLAPRGSACVRCTIIALGAVLSAVNLVKYFCAGGNTSAFWGIDYANALASVLLVSACTAACAMSGAVNVRRRILWGACLGLCAAAIWITKCRAVWALALAALPLSALIGARNLRRRTRLYISLGLLTVYAAAALLLAPRVLPQLLNATELLERFASDHDALAVIGRAPWSGLGAGGWESRQFSFQTARYGMRYVHCSLLQAGADGGVPGMLLSGAAALFPILYGLRRMRSEKAVRLPTLCCAMLFLHSLFDFVFSIPGVWMIYLLLAAQILPEGRPLTAGTEKRAAAACGLLLPAALCLFVSELFFSAGLRAYAAQSYQTAETRLETAEALDRASAEIPYTLSFVSVSRIQNGTAPQYVSQAADELKRAEALDRGNYKYADAQAMLFSLSGDPKSAAEMFKKEISLHPLAEQGYNGLAASLSALLRTGENPSDREYAEDSVSWALNELDAARSGCSPLAWRLKHTPAFDESRLALEAVCASHEENGEAE